MREATPHDRPFRPAPPEEALAGYTPEGGRRWIDPVVTRGLFWRWRLGIGALLLALFFAAPLLILGGHPLVFLDVANRRFHLLGATFHPTDNLLLVALGLLLVLTLFTMTALFGRLLCGFLCPQTHLLEFIFRPIESLVEGPAERRWKRRNQAQDTASRLRRLLKWAIYLVLALLFAHNLLALFLGWDRLFSLLIAGPLESPTIFVLASLITGFLFVDMAFLRENVCAMACPYGRLQTVLYDRDTRIVAYDARRGEPRGPRRGVSGGDCLDCGRCVRTCPAGIDIRRGLQMECVGCGQCADACDAVQTRLGRPRGLLSFTSETRLEGGRSSYLPYLRRRVRVYGSLWALALGALIFLLARRADAEVELLRSTRAPFEVLPSGEIATSLRVRVTNLRRQPQSFTLERLEPEEARIAGGEQTLTVAPQEVENLLVSVVLPRASFADGRATVWLRLRSDLGFVEESPFLLLGPYR